MKRIILALVVVSSFATGATAKQCLSPSAPKHSTKYEGGRVTQTVLCCCRVAGGSQCCNYVAICMGNFIPGCFCSNFNKPHLPTQKY